MKSETKDLTSFGDVISAIAAEKKLTQRAIAEDVGCSPSTLSLVGNGDRNLTSGLATELARVLGGTQDIWASIFTETQRGSKHPISFFRSKLVMHSPLENLPGSRVRRLRKDHIMAFLTTSNEFSFGPNDTGKFLIDEFDESNVGLASYDTVLGSIRVPPDNSRIEVDSDYYLPPETFAVATTKEAVVLPTWMEADVHPATIFAKKHLIVSECSIIGPSFDNFLTAAIYNPTKEPVRIGFGEPFLTIRFWLQESF